MHTSRARLVQLRSSAFDNQRGICTYCSRPMWTSHMRAFARAHGLTLRQARPRFCTAEHLHARCDGGRNSESNIAAACRECNQGRHQIRPAPAPEVWRRIRQAAISAVGCASESLRPCVHQESIPCTPSWSRLHSPR
jgi:5-methylcytosine-specific restriction endonuclease McrA